MAARSCCYWHEEVIVDGQKARCGYHSGVAVLCCVKCHWKKWFHIHEPTVPIYFYEEELTELGIA